MTTMTTRRAFTLLELTLAMVVGAMILVLAATIFIAVDRSDRAFAAALERTSQVEIAQGTMRRAFLRLVMAPNAAVEPDVPPRPRLLLTDDPAATGAQRFEIVVSRPPIAPILAGPAGAAAFAMEDSASLNFLAPEGSGGQSRGVFELRPDGTRERVMASLGAGNPLWDVPTDRPYTASPPVAEPPPGWTLWWRRMPADEVAALQSGVPAWRDGEDPNPSFEAQRLASSIRLITGLTQARWRVFKKDAWTDTFDGTMVNDLPAYLQFTATTNDGQFVQWLFEVDWTESIQVGTDEAANELLGAGAEGGQGAQPGADADGDGQPDPVEPGDQGRPGQRPDRPGRPGKGPGGNPGDGGTTNPPRPDGSSGPHIKAFREGYQR